jgi:beta-N-acetylhexosaminidase
MEDFGGPVMRRRLVAGLIVAAIVGAAAGLLIVEGDEVDERPALSAQAGLSPQSSILANQLTTEQLVDQVLLLGFEGTDGGAPIVAELADRQLGGVLVQAGNWLGSGPGAELTRAIHTAGASGARIPPLVVVSQEGGRYRSLTDLPPAATELEIGDTGSTDVAADWAMETGRALRQAGFDLNLFPVADVATLDSPVADRAFSDDPAVAARMTAAAIRGCRNARIACAPVHFPGLGAASQDTAQGPATVSLDAASLEARDLPAFEAAFAERAPAVVLSLAFYAAYDPVTPGALAAPVTTGLLRDEVGYEGVAITDDLGSGAVRAEFSVPRAAVAALSAGADLIQIGSPSDQQGVREALLSALESGDLSESRLREAAGRVLELKRALGLLAAQ